MKKELMILGPYIYPLNGISVHIKRVMERIGNLKDIKVSYLPISIQNPQFSFFSKIILGSSRIMIHLHSYHPIFLLEALFLRTKKNRLIFTIHSEGIPNILEHGNLLYKFLVLRFLKKCNDIICVNPSIAKRIIAFGIEKTKVSVVPAFIHPVLNFQEKNVLPARFEEWRDRCKIILCANAGLAGVTEFEAIYGLDLLKSLMEKFKNDKSIHLVLFLAIDKNLAKYNLKKLIAPNISLFIGGRFELYPIIARSDLFLRPTRTDGFSLSVAESLILGIPVIASDVVSRPKGTILFKTNDFNDFYKKVIITLSSLRNIKDKMQKIKVYDNFNDLIRIYNMN